MQTSDGKLHEISTAEFDRMYMERGVRAPVVRAGDVFRIRGCYFKVECVLNSDDSPYAIRALGITKEEHDKAKGMY